MFNAVIIGSGPNGLAAGIRLAQEGLSVKIFEAADTPGGGMRTKELTLPGFKHDVCSSVYPAAVSSPYFKTLPLEDYGLEWIYPEYPLAHPLDDQPAVILHHSIKKTAEGLGKDHQAYEKLFNPFAERWDELASHLFGPLAAIPSAPILTARFGIKALRSAESLASAQFSTERAKALFAGLAAHSILPLDAPVTSAYGMMLGIMGHAKGWPVAEGGGGRIADALAGYFKSLGGKIETNAEITSLDMLPEARSVLFDTSPEGILDIAGGKLSDSYAKRLDRFEYGAGVFKMDIALDGPIPWNDERCLKAGTVHLGGSFDEIAGSEKKTSEGIHPSEPFVLLAQPSLFDVTRAPDGKHTVWAYCHVPNGSTRDMREPILNQIERFASGFREKIIEVHTMNTQQVQAYNPNYIGGDISGGKQNLKQMLRRPKMFNPYQIPQTNMYICSSSTPPGGGVHGMCGYYAAQAVLEEL